MALEKRLGLDLGVASIGWALLEYENQEFKRVLGCGSRIIPQGTHQGEFERGEAITKNADRRMQRSARRLRQRYKQRRENLGRVLAELGVSSTDMLAEAMLGTDPAKPYFERAAAVEEAVSLKALGRVLWRINDRRGYKSNRNERADLARHKRSETTYEELTIISRRDLDEQLRGKTVVEVELSNGVFATTTDQTLLLARHGEVRGVSLTAKKRKGDLVPSYTVALANADEWGSRLASMDRRLEESELTPGQFFARELRADRHFRVRQRLVYRSRYVEEFERIWARQVAAHPILSDQGTFERVLRRVLPRNTRQLEHWAAKDLGVFVRDYILFFQRPLKTKRSTVGDCPIEHMSVDYVDRDSGEVTKREVARKVIPASHPLYQEFRTWAAINNIRLQRDGESDGKPLPDALKARLFGLLQTQATLTAGQLAKLLPEVSKEYTISAQDTLPGNATRTKLAAAAEKAGTTLGALNINDPASLTDLWHLLYSHNDDAEAVERTLVGRFSMAPEVAEQFGYVTFPRDRGPYSAKAIAKLLPVMRAGDYHAGVAVSRFAGRRLKDYREGELPAALMQVLAKAHLPAAAGVDDARGLTVYAALALQYGHHEGKREQVAKLDRWEDIELVPRHSLRNPIVERIANEALQVVRDIWQTYGRPDDIRVELARELKASKDERERRHKHNRDRESANNRDRTTLQATPFNLAEPTRKDILRFKLWQEQGGECVYTGRKIQAADLFSGATDIDHILPQQRYQDDSYGNKVLTFRSVNENKGNATAMEYVRAGDTKHGVMTPTAYRAHLDELYPQRSHKRQLLLAEEIPDDFGARALQNTRYMSKAIVRLLEPIAPGKVKTTAGPVTAYLRRSWGLDEAFKELVRQRYERLGRIHGEKWAEDRIASNGRRYLWLNEYSKRVDHRHHALDAIVTAATTQGMIQRLSSLSQAYDEARADGRDRIAKGVDRNILSPVYDFADQVLETLRSVIVSHKPTNRLLTQSINRFQVRDPKTGKIVKLRQAPAQTLAVRGQLHVEQAFGRVRHYAMANLQEAFAKTDTIAIDWQRELVAERLFTHEGDVRAAVRSLKDMPLCNSRGEPLEEVIIWKVAFAKNRSVEGLSSQQLGEVADQGAIGKPLQEFLKRPEVKKLDATEIERFNAERIAAGGNGTQPVQTSRTHSFGNKTRLVRQGGPNNNWIDTGDSYALGVTELANGKRDFENVKFFDAIQRTLAGTTPIGDCDFAIKKGETVALLSEEGDVMIDGARYQLYVNRRISEQSSSTRFAPLNWAVGLAREFVSPSYDDSAPNSIELVPRIIRNYCYPISVDRLGRVQFDGRAAQDDIPG